MPTTIRGARTRRALRTKLWARTLEIIDELPVSAGGKVAKARLKEDITYKLQVEAVSSQ